MFHPQSASLQSEEISEITSDRERTRQGIISSIRSIKIKQKCLKLPQHCKRVIFNAFCFKIWKYLKILFQDIFSFDTFFMIWYITEVGDATNCYIFYIHLSKNFILFHSWRHRLPQEDKLLHLSGKVDVYLTNPRVEPTNCQTKVKVCIRLFESLRQKGASEDNGLVWLHSG